MINVNRKKKCSMNTERIKPIEFDLTGEKYNDIIKSNPKLSKSSKRVSSTKKPIEKFSFFGSAKPKTGTGFFGSWKTSYIDDKPSPEPLGKSYEKRKNIIFKRLNIKNDEKEILKLILESQKKANNLIKGKIGFFFYPQEIHEWTIVLKENIANYCLVFHLYLLSKQANKASELFLLLDQQNRDLLSSIAHQIKKNFKNMSNNNRIAKFYPSIITIFFQILSVIIKFASKFNKNLIEDHYLKIYIEVIYEIRETIIKRFTSVNNDLENDFKLMGRYFYYNCIYTISIYFLYRYQSLKIIISIFLFILEQYQEKDLINSEQLLLLKINYNLGLLYYVEGNAIEAIVHLNQCKNKLKEISLFPYTILKENTNPVSYALSSTKMNTNNEYSNNYCPDRTSISSFNIDESVDKYVTSGRLKKRSISSRLSRDMGITQRSFEPTKRVCSNIIFGKEKFIFREQMRFINECLSQKIDIEIELFLAEIELDQKNYKQSFIHVNKILDIVRQPPKKYNKEFLGSCKKAFNMENSSPHNNSVYFKLAEYNKNSYSNHQITTSIFNIPKIQLNQIISESNKRHISYILEEIEQEYRKRTEYGNSNQDLNNILYDDYKSSKTDRYEYDRRLNENIKRENKISLETEKFFIFICGLSLYQLKILNEFQPEPSKKRDDLPILFPNQFKDCLTFSQRMALNDLDTMSLSRYVILKDSSKDISPDNLDYVFLTRKIKSSHKDKNLDVIIENNNNENFYEIAKKMSKDSFDENSGEGKDNIKGENTKNNLFDKERFQKFVEEDKIFNQKITEITKKDNKKFLERNRHKILKILHGLKTKEKQLLMKSSQCFNDFLKKIEKKMSKKKLSDI